MKSKLTVMICVLALVLASAPRCEASDHSTSADPGEVVADIIVVRPACFVATVLGSVLFVISLPVAATSKSVHRTAHALVVQPAQATFTRPLGDMGALTEY
jgi:hypothetical protein